MPDLLRRRRRDDDGFTLVELLIVIVLLGVVGTIFLTTVLSATRVDSTTRARADVQQSVTVGMQRLTKQVRVAAPLVSVPQPHLVQVDVYPTTAGTIRHRYTYTVAGGELRETIEVFNPSTSSTPVSTTPRVLLRGVQANTSRPGCSPTAPATTDTFVFCDRAGAATTTQTRVASIKVRLTAKAKDAKALFVETDIFLRNFQE